MISDMTIRFESLPQPSDGFDWVQAGGHWALVCRALMPFADHLFTTRLWALGSGANDTGADAWSEVAGALGLPPANLVRLRQVHRADVVVASGPVPVPAEADIVVARDGSIGITVQAADCVPLLVADERSGVVAAAHAGWRGLAANVPAAVVGAMVRECGSRAADLVVAIGPSIGPCCYEVGADVREQFEASGASRPELDRWFRFDVLETPRNGSILKARGGLTPGRSVLDTWRATRDRLEAAGVGSGRIFEAGLCTASHDVLCSYRRDGTAAGRIAAAIRSRSRRPSLGSPDDRRARSVRDRHARS
jgi:YfiH family protein